MAEDLFDALRRAAALDPAPELDPETANAMIERAMVAAESDDGTPPSRMDGAAGVRQPAAPTRWVVAVAVLAAAVLLGVAYAGDHEAPPTGALEARSMGAPSRMMLPTGDVLTVAASAEYEIDSVTPDRRLRVRSGTVLIDAAPRPDSELRVTLPDLEVLVLGTVFSVQASNGVSRVWVYEGRVEVRGPDGGARALGAGESIRSDTFGAAQRVDALAHEGRLAAEARLAVAPRAAPAQTAPPERVGSDGVEPAIHRPTERRASAQPRRAPPTDLSAARSSLAGGHAQRALELATDALRRGEDAQWLVLRADALRALDRPRDALDDLARAAQLSPERAPLIGYRIAQVRLRRLGDARGSLEALREHGVTAEGSPLAERGLALGIEAHRRLGDASARERTERERDARFPRRP